MFRAGQLGVGRGGRRWNPRESGDGIRIKFIAMKKMGMVSSNFRRDMCRDECTFMTNFSP